MSLSNMLILVVVPGASLRLVTILGVGGVGSSGLGIAFLLWLENAENVVLRGVPMEASSEPSGLDMVSCLVFKLMDDLFFLSGPGLGPRDLDSAFDSSVLSVGMVGKIEDVKMADVAGEAVGAVAAGLGAR